MGLFAFRRGHPVVTVTFTITGTPAAFGNVGSAYLFTPTANNATGSVTWAYSGPSLSGTGLSFSTSTGAISGTPTGAATLSGMNITAVDSASHSASLAANPFSIVISVAAPLVAPGASWTGVPLSGGTPPTDPTRTTAKPALLWYQPSLQRLSGNTVIGVQSRSLGATNTVTFWVEGNTQTVSRSVDAYVDVNGVTHSRIGWFITLDVATAAAAHNGGGVRVYATATANDGTMQQRTIGGTPATGFTGGGTMQFYVATTAHDFTYTLASTNSGTAPNFKTLKAVLDYAASTDSAKAPLITCTHNGDVFELDNRTGNYGGSQGYATITHSPGVAVTFGRSAFLGPNQYSDWIWLYSYDQLAFAGSGITIDFRHVQGLEARSTPCLMNGVTLTSSAPAAPGQSSSRDSLDWFGGPRPRGNGTCYFMDCQIKYLSAPLCYQPLVLRNTIIECFNIMYTGSQYVAGNAAIDCTSDFYRGHNAQGQPSFSVSYSGIGTSPTVTLNPSSDDGTSNDATITFATSIGSVTYTLSAVINYPGSNFYATDLHTTVAGGVAGILGFSVTSLSAWRCSESKGVWNGSSFDQVITSFPATFNAGQDMHTDYWQAFTDGSSVRENCITENNSQLGLGTEGFQLFFQDTPVKDVFHANNISNVGVSAWGSGYAASHYCLENNSGGSATLAGVLCDSYCAALNNTFVNMANSTGVNYPTYPAFKGNAIQGTQPDNAASSGNFSISAGQAAAMFTSPSTNDFTPAGVLLTDTVAPVADAPTDNQGNVRANPDAIGALTLAATAPVYRFATWPN